MELRRGCCDDDATRWVLPARIGSGCTPQQLLFSVLPRRTFYLPPTRPCALLSLAARGVMGCGTSKASNEADAAVEGIAGLTVGQVNLESVPTNSETSSAPAAAADGIVDEKHTTPQKTPPVLDKATTPKPHGGRKSYLPSGKPDNKNTGKRKGGTSYKGKKAWEADDEWKKENQASASLRKTKGFDAPDSPNVAGGQHEEYDPINDTAEEDLVEGDTQWGDTVSWLEKEMRGMRIASDYPDVLQKSVQILRKWRTRFPKPVWLRVIKSGRIAKELNECAPVIAKVIAHVDNMRTPSETSQRVNIVDLCSGFGYLGMFLSEMLDPRKVKMIVLLDKQVRPDGAFPNPPPTFDAPSATSTAVIQRKYPTHSTSALFYLSASDFLSIHRDIR